MVLVIKKNFVKGKHNFRPNDKILKLQKKAPQGRFNQSAIIL